MSAKKFTGSELQKELAVHRHIEPWMPEINRLLSELSISLKNKLHFAERVSLLIARRKLR